MSRLQAKTFDELSPQQQTLFEEIVDNRPVKPVDGEYWRTLRYLVTQPGARQTTSRSRQFFSV